MPKLKTVRGDFVEGGLFFLLLLVITAQRMSTLPQQNVLISTVACLLR